MAGAAAEDHSVILGNFRRGPDILEAALQDVSTEESHFSPAPGKWNIRQIARHVADTEIVAGMRLRQMIAEPNPLMAVFDQDLWAEHLQYDNCDPFDSAKKFRMLREDMAGVLDRLPASVFDNVGMHPERGPATLAEWVDRFGVHVQKHATQITNLREQWKSR